MLDAFVIGRVGMFLGRELDDCKRGVGCVGGGGVMESLVRDERKKVCWDGAYEMRGERLERDCRIFGAGAERMVVVVRKSGKGWVGRRV